MIGNTYYESTTLSTTESSYIEDSNKSVDKKFSDLYLENLTNEKEALLNQLIKLIEEIIEENKLNLISEGNESEIKDSKEQEEEEMEKNEREFFRKLFILEQKPNINLSNYIYRINKYLDPEISTMIISFIYIDKLTSSKNLNFKIDEINVYKLILTALIVALKYNEDDTNDNKFFSKVGGLDLGELNKLELNFCAKLKWELFISNEVFKEYYIHLLSI